MQLTPPARSIALTAVLLGSGCSSAPPLGSVPPDLVALADRATASSALALEVDRDGAVRSMAVEIPVSALPTAVREAALAAESDSTIVGAGRVARLDGATWEVALLHEGRRVELALTEDGAVREIHRELRRDEVPRSILTAADGAVPGGTFQAFAILHRGSETEYHVDKEVDAAVHRVVVSADGLTRRTLRHVPTTLGFPER